ncbi:calcium-binding protein [Methylobacterium sp. CM6241]
MSSVEINTAAEFPLRNFWLEDFSEVDNAYFSERQSTQNEVGRRTETYSSFSLVVDNKVYTYIGEWTVDVRYGVLNGTAEFFGTYDSATVTDNGEIIAAYSGEPLDVDLGSTGEVGALGIVGGIVGAVLGGVVNLLFGSTANDLAVENLNLDETPNLPGLAIGETYDLTGGNGDNTLRGSNGDNVIDGGTGNDTMIGGGGDDTYVVGSAGDIVVEDAVEGDDTVRSSVTYTLPDNVENLVLTGTSDIDGTGNALDNSITGNDGDNRLDGGDGNDILIGGGGDDTYIVNSAGDTVVEAAGEGDDTVRSSVTYTLPDNVENLILTGTGDIDGTGNALDNSIVGNASDNRLDGGDGNDRLTALGGDDILIGGTGDDIMRGGAGDDVYVVDSTGDEVIEAADEGNDTVRSSVTYSLGANVENVILIGTGAIDATGTDGADGLTGNDSANRLDGGAGEDTLSGRGGNDTLIGGTGADTMRGGTGDDTYVVDDASDQVIELAGDGTDTVRSSLDYTLGANVERLVLTGAGNLDGTGNTLNNSIFGTGGDNTLRGESGSDFLFGKGGADILDGGTGNDTMHGGLGDDTYFVDRVGDKIVELPGEGNDTVYASVTYGLSANVENLVLTGARNLSGFGNDLDNDITGNGGSNRLSGGAGDDVMTGNGGNDTLLGGSGADTMRGGTGNDTYLIDNAGDRAIEQPGEGFDTIRSTVSHTMEANTEKMVLSGNVALVANGNAGNNEIFGNAGDTEIYGGDGRDLLYGRGGADTFVFKDATDSDVAIGGRDIVKDFDFAAGDRIDLSAIDANFGQAGDQGFEFIGTQAFSGEAGELRVKFAGGNALVQGDTNGDGASDFDFILQGHQAIDSGSFIL